MLWHTAFAHVHVVGELTPTGLEFACFLNTDSVVFPLVIVRYVKSICEGFQVTSTKACCSQAFPQTCITLDDNRGRSVEFLSMRGTFTLALSPTLNTTAFWLYYSSSIHLTLFSYCMNIGLSSYEWNCIVFSAVISPLSAISFPLSSSLTSVPLGNYFLQHSVDKFLFVVTEEKYICAIMGSTCMCMLRAQFAIYLCSIDGSPK